MNFTVSTTTDLKACHDIRMEVFVKEQKVPVEEEIDDLDGNAIHYLCRDDSGKAVGTARVYEQGDTGKIGRVCVLKDYRGMGLGVRIINACLHDLSTRPHLGKAKLGAQTHAIPFYEKLGFVAYGSEYLDGGIPHVDMVKDLRF